MTRFIKLSAPLLAIAAILTLVGVTQAANDDVSLKGVDLGTHVYGPQVDADALKGKVVVFEYWGDRCPPCIRAIPHLVKIQEKYGDKKLHIVANQVWTKDTEAAKKAWKNAGGSNAISVVNHGKLEGAKLKGVPHSFIFDHTGKLLWHGHPANKKFDETIKDATEKLPSKS